MKGIRFQLMDGLGIMQGLDEHDVSIEAQLDLLEKFNNELHAPMQCFGAHTYNVSSYFTLLGYEYFKKEIEYLIEYWNSIGIKIEKVERNIAEDELLYDDDYQMIIGEVYDE